VREDRGGSANQPAQLGFNLLGDAIQDLVEPSL